MGPFTSIYTRFRNRFSGMKCVTLDQKNELSSVKCSEPMFRRSKRSTKNRAIPLRLGRAFGQRQELFSHPSRAHSACLTAWGWRLVMSPQQAARHTRTQCKKGMCPNMYSTLFLLDIYQSTLFLI